ncbi:hypothetical protein HOE52_03950 [Candidatus Woesearchaeota archaeon]|jgi:hypothetical protein|nr:hypothetical protein [Candidatus Woesearchaeota archaeon]
MKKTIVSLLALAVLLLLIVGCSTKSLDSPSNEILASFEVKEIPYPIEIQDEIEDDESHWTKVPISYYIDEKVCKPYETRKIQKAFKKIQESTGNVVTFIQESNPENSNINVYCSFLKDCYLKTAYEEGQYIYVEESICQHDLGVASITEYDGNRILKAEIEMIGLDGFSESYHRGMSGFFIGSCGHPTTEIHEILHTFGYGHDDDPESIMYYQAEGIMYTLLEGDECVGSNVEIDDWIIEDLIQTYG